MSDPFDFFDVTTQNVWSKDLEIAGNMLVFQIVLGIR